MLPIHERRDYPLEQARRLFLADRNRFDIGHSNPDSSPVKANRPSAWRRPFITTLTWRVRFLVTYSTVFGPLETHNSLVRIAMMFFENSVRHAEVRALFGPRRAR